jgi:hypothetical protein
MQEEVETMAMVRNRFAALLLVGSMGIVLGGCAAIRNARAIDTERMLAAAGFQMKMADTPEKLDRLEAMTQRKLVPHQKDGKVFYVYADATSCKCIYVGTEQAYQRYQKILVQKQIADEQMQAAEMNEDASMNWDAWGPWGPWY